MIDYPVKNQSINKVQDTNEDIEKSQKVEISDKKYKTTWYRWVILYTVGIGAMMQLFIQNTMVPAA